MKLKNFRFLMFLVFALFFSTTAWAVPTLLTVRVKSHDGKFVGTSVGDAQVTVRDFNSREVLATGFVSGSTGNTKILMKTDRKRTTQLSDDKTAAFVTSLDINAPRKLLVEVDGPLSAGIDAHHEAKTTWLIPGNDITGDGLMFEMYGLIVRNYHPLPHENIIVGKPVTIGAHVAMMCGCPTRPGFIWNSDKFTIKAIVEKNGKVIADLPLNYAGSLSNFEANYTFNDVGVYKITTIAIDDKNNQGIDVTSFSVRTAKKFNKLSGIKSK